jgi:5-methylcytosine-specific restriction endonuclease McrA
MTLRPELSRASWRRTRAYVRRRDDNRCTVCGSNGWIPQHFSRSGRLIPGRYRLIVGHIVPAERSGLHHDDPRGLRTMCVRRNNSQRDLSDEQWREARAARGQPVTPSPGSSVITRDYTRRTIFDKPARPPRVW